MSETAAQPAVIDAPARNRRAKGDREPCVGLPVVFTLNDGTVIPGVLQRRSLTDTSLFDVKISLSGAGTQVTRTAVKCSVEPKPGCWSYVPGL